MNRLMAVAVLVLASGVAHGQQMPDRIRQQIDEHYIGTWDFTLTSAEANVAGVFTARWAPGKHCVLVEDTTKGPNGSVHNSGILAWQPDTQSVVHIGYGSNGDYYEIKYNQFDSEENRWSGTVTGLVNGESGEPSDVSVTWLKDRIEYKDAIYVFVATRKQGKQKEAAAKSSSQDTTAADFAEFRKMMEGRWIGKVTWVADWPGLGKQGDVVTGYMDIRSDGDGNVLVGEFDGGEGSGLGMWYYDAAARRIRVTYVDSGGTVDTLTYFKQDGQWIESGTGSLRDGTKTSYKGTMEFSDDGTNLTFRGQGKVGGKPTADRNDVWRRVYK